MGIGRASGESRAEDAAKQAISNPLLESSIEGAKGVIINITGGSNLGLHEVNTAAEIVQRSADPEANIIFGAVIDESIDEDIIITVIATGFEMDSKPTFGGVPTTSSVVNPLNNNIPQPKPWEQKAVQVPSKPEAVNPNDLDIPSFLRKKNGNKQ